MKFAFIVTNLVAGGAEKAMLKLTTGLAGRGHEAHLILLEHLVDHAIPANICVHALGRSGRRLSKGVIGKAIAALRLRRLFHRLMTENPFDLIVSTLPFADEIALRARLPRHWCRVANTLSAEIARLRAYHPAKARRRLVRYRNLYRSRPLIAVSDGVAADLHTLLGRGQTRIERIYNPFDFASIRARAAESAPLPERPYVIHVGRFTAQKRHDLLLDSWVQLDIPHRLVLLASPRPELNAMIEARGLKQRVTVAGLQSNPYPWIAGADLLVLCSDHEGLPNVIIEALALGTPVVSTDCPSGPREILGNVYPECLVPVGDVDALARAIRQALTAHPDPTRADLAPYAADTVAAAYERLAAEPALCPNDGRAT